MKKISVCGVKCSWDGLPEGRNCFCVWSFWCSELCSVDQTVIFKKGSVLDVKGPEWFFQYSSWRVGRVPMIRSAVQTSLRSLLRSDLVAELNQMVIDMQRTDSMMAEIVASGPCQSWSPNNPHPLKWLYHSLFSPPVAGVWWAHTLDWLYDCLLSTCSWCVVSA